MFRRLCLLSFLLSAFWFPPTHSLAQTINEKTEQKFNLPPFEEIPEPFLQEMNEVFTDCNQKGSFENVRDCRCYALSYLEAKVQNPFFDRTAIENRLETACLEPEKLVRVHFGSCLNYMRNSGGGRENTKSRTEEICTCYGEYMAEKLVLLDNLDSRTLIHLKNDAHSECNS